MIVLKGLRAGVDHLAFSPDGSALLASCWGAVAVWPLPVGRPVVIYPNLYGASLSVDGAWIVGTYNPGVLPPVCRVCRIEWRIGTEVFGDDTVGVLAGCFMRPCPDGLRVANAAHLFTWLSWPDLRKFPSWKYPDIHTYAALDVAFSPDGVSAAVMQDDQVTRHVTATGRRVWAFAIARSKGKRPVTWSPDGRFIAAATNRDVWVLDPADGRAVTRLTQERADFQEMQFTPDGRFLASVNNEVTVKFFETQTWQLRHELMWDVGRLRTIAFSKDGMLAAVGGAGKKVVVWDLDL